MKLFSWNIRGINNPSKHRMLRQIILQDKPSVLFVQETKCTSTLLETLLKRIWKGSNVIVVDAMGALGGLVISWKALEITIQDSFATINTISASYQLTRPRCRGQLMNVYGPQTP